MQYGTSSDALNLQACSTTSVTYPTSRTWSNAVILSGLSPATTYYYKIVSTNSSIEHFFSPRTSGDTTPFTLSVVIDLGVYGADGYTISMDATKRDTIPTVQPALNHTTIGRLATNINNYEFVVHPGDFGTFPIPILIPHRTNALQHTQTTGSKSPRTSSTAKTPTKPSSNNSTTNLPPSPGENPTWPAPETTKPIVKN